MTDPDIIKDTENDEPFFRKVLYVFSFNIRLILKNISNRKRSTIIVILGLIFSLSILYTSSIWTHTSEKIIADDYIETLDYEMYVTSFLTHSMDEVYTYVSQDQVVEQVDWLYPSVALFNFDDKNDTYRWYPEDDQDNMTNPLSLSAGFVVSSRSLNRIKLNLEIEGKSELNSGEILISYTQAKQLESIFNETVVPGYKIDVAITRRIPNTDEGEIYMLHYDIDETKFYNYTVAGIYKYVGHNTVIDRLLGGGTSGSGGTIVDSIFFPIEDLTSLDLFIMDGWGILPRLLVKTDPQQLRIDGITSMPDNLLALRERIEIRFFHAFCYILSQEIQTMTEEYKRSFASTTLFIPTIATAVVLTILSSHMTVRRRREEIAFLRSKGAVSSQIIGIFFGEFLFISIVSLVISIGTGILIAAIIPSVGHNSVFNTSLFVRYLSELEMSFYDIEIFSILVLGIYLGWTLLNVITFVRKDIQESLLVTRKGQQFLTMGLKIAAFALTIAGFIFLLLDYLKLEQESFTFNLSLITASSNSLYLFVGIIFFTCYFVSLGINYLLKKSEVILSLIFKNSKFFIIKNIRRYRKSFTDTTFFLILIICLLTSFLTIRSSTIKNNILENEYREGADLRIDTVIPVNITDFENLLTNIEGINESIGFYTAKATVGFQDVEVFGIDPLKYLRIGMWLDNSFVGMTAEEGLTALANEEEGVILSDFVVDRLEFSLGQILSITSFRGGPFYVDFRLTSIISSAPGLGVAHGHDPKMNRITNEWALINENYFLQMIEQKNSTLFFASIKENADVEQIIEQIKEINPLVVINPTPINPEYIGYFLVDYIPPVAVSLLLGAIFLNVIGVVYIIISTDFILEQRRRENAVMLALGGKQQDIRKMIISEILIFMTTTVIIGFILGLILTTVLLVFIKPLIISREVVSLAIFIDVVPFIIMFVTLFAAAMIGLIPILRKQMKHEIINELRAIV
ncbi:MAG: FtsX-like permease family protein [Candidatus Thorarchaeota archaeon]